MVAPTDAHLVPWPRFRRAVTGSFCAKIVVLLAVVLATLPGGCGTQAPPPPADPVRVLTTVYALADIVRQVGGERVNVEWFVESGQSLDQLKETPQRRQQWRSADLVVTRGLPDPWTYQGDGNAFQPSRILRVDTLPSARDADATTYLWLDPDVAIEIAREVAARLTAVDPKNDQLFKRNCDSFVQQVAALTKQADAAIRRAGPQPFVTLDHGFGPVAARFGMVEARLPQQVDPVQPTQYSAKILRQAADDVGAGAVFANSETPSTLLRDWEGRLDLPVLTLDALGTSASTGRSTYLALLQYNLEQLERGATLSAKRASTAGGGGAATRPASTAPVPLGAVLDSGAAPAPPSRETAAPPADQPADESNDAPVVRPSSLPPVRVAPVPPRNTEPSLNLPEPPVAPASQPARPSPFRPIPRGP